MTPTVLIGPKTRLGQAVQQEARDSVLVLARDASDVAGVVATGFSPQSIVDASTREVAARVAALPAGPVRLIVAALGPVHPVEPDFEADLAGVQRDLGYVDQVLASGRQVEVVLISTVIALAPGADRRYYGGWKALVEELLAHRVAQAGSSLTVLYPGRIREGRAARPWHLLHVSYPGLARVALGDHSDSTRRTVGVDSRIWLAVRSISFAVRSLGFSTGRRRSVLGGTRDSGSTGKTRE